MNALEVKNLTKVYPKFTLDHVGFTVGEGRIAGLIGRNGAGKSTTLKGILGILSASGSVSVFGRELNGAEREVKELIGYVGGGFRYYPAKRLASVSKAVSRFYSQWQENVYRKYLAEFGLDEAKKVRELSEGMKVKYALLLALSHGARLLVLDEPTSGLDPLSREEFYEIILSVVERERVSVLFSTHITSDLEKIADDVIYLSEGKVLFAEPIGEMIQRYCLAAFPTREEAEGSGAIGIKRTKEGFDGLLPQEAVGRGNITAKPASLEDIVVHFEISRRDA